jgi:hypothetical protein
MRSVNEDDIKIQVTSNFNLLLYKFLVQIFQANFKSKIIKIFSILFIPVK